MTGLIESPWPDPVAAFQKFLRDAGLTCVRREIDAESGGKFLQYGNAIIAVRLVFDGSHWLVEVAETRFRPDEWHDAAMLLDLLTGDSEDALPLARQIEIVTANWRAILRAFSPDRVHDSQMRLAFLRLERAKRRGAGSVETAD